MAKEPEDRFETYFAEKIWEMVPPFYRHEDGIAENPGVLRALVEIIAGQAAILRRSHDCLWDDQSIELCSDWAVPYIADLVGTRLISALNKRARRVDVAKTIYYRRRKGTLRVLEELISDIAGWEGKVVENFRRLCRCRHGLDPKPASLAGRFTGTLPGGWADLRQQRGSELTGGPFDEYHHTPDMRRHRGLPGRYNIPKLAFHLYRLVAYRVEGVTPWLREDGMSFTFDPSGRDVPLFMRRNREGDWDRWRSAREWELPAPMRCRLLSHAEYELTESIVQMLVDDHELSDDAANELQTLCGVRFKSESRLRQRLETLDYHADFLEENVYLLMLQEAIIEDCGKKALLPNVVQVIAMAPEGEVPRERIVAGNLSDWTANAPGKRLVIDPEQGRFLFLSDEHPGDVTVSYHYGFSGEIGAGTYDRPGFEETIPDDHVSPGGGEILTNFCAENGITQIDDSRTYDLVEDGTGEISVTVLTLQAANQQRPYIRLNTDCRFTTDVDADAVLILDGLWIGNISNNGNYAIVLTGDYEKVVVRNCTLDPGGNDANGNPIAPVPLFVEGQVELLIIESSITGPILTREGGKIERLDVCDSIIQSGSGPAIELSAGEVYMGRVTIFGFVNVHRLWATEVLITRDANVFDCQNGCFRFGAVPAESQLPRPYESHWIHDSNHLFTSRCFGQPGYGQFSEAAPLELRRGAENGSEIGAFSKLINPIKLDSLKFKVEEYMPFGLIPIFIQET